MIQKHWQFSILLVVLICVHSVCPLLCAAAGQSLCHFSTENSMTEHTETSSTCCHTLNTDKTDVDSDGVDACCYNDITFVISNVARIVDYLEQTERHQVASIIPLTLFLPTTQVILLHQSYPTIPPISYLNNVIFRRGPPSILS